MQKDTTLKKIFVGGLPYHTTDESLKKFFEQFGSIEEAVVITDRQTGKSRGYGFVTMARSDEALMAIRDPNPCIDGRKANVNLAVLGAKPRQLPGASTNLFNQVESLPMTGGQFYNAPIINQAPNMLSTYNGMNISPNLCQNMAMKNMMMGQQQQQTARQVPNPIPNGNLIGINGQTDMLFNGSTQQPNSLVEYFAMLISQNTAGQAGFNSQNQTNMSQTQLNQMYLQLLNQKNGQNSLQSNAIFGGPHSILVSSPSSINSSTNETSIYHKSQFNNTLNPSQRNLFNNQILDSSLVQLNLAGTNNGKTNTTYQSAGTTELA